MDVLIDVFYEGKTLIPAGIAAAVGMDGTDWDYCVKDGDDFILFNGEQWVGRHVMVQEIGKDRVHVQVGDDMRAPIPWRSVEAALTAGGR